ncbi:site-specific integrase [Runella limosa]|uniref:site-specific integrase n=1 Tax=Runella limosa TaxID=370978 RepID=UPI000423899F|nr:site-specific integrase [Runella limosa]
MKIVIRFKVRSKKNALANTPHYIYCRLTVNGIQARSDMATGVHCKRDEWDNNFQQIKGDTEGVRLQNQKLQQMRDDLDEIFNEYRKYDKAITAEIIKQAYLNKNDVTPRTILVWYNKYIDEDLRQRIQDDTIDSWLSRRNVLSQYITEVLKRKDVDIQEVTAAWLRSYQKYHISKGNGADHAARSIGSIKKVLDYAVIEGALSYNSTVSYKPPRSKRSPIKYLSATEVQQLATCPYYSDRLQRIVDCFLLQTYTGMAYKELYTFDAKKHLTTDELGIGWIMIHRGKTQELSTIPILRQTRDLLEKYNYKLPVITNQRMNEYIKEAATIAGFPPEKVEDFTTHLARKTAGMFLLNSGLRIETVSKILGHKSIKVTERHYAKILTSSIVKDLKNNGLLV